MGYVPDLHKIWVGTSDQQLMALSNEFPGFYRYALILEEASEAERNKASRPYDGMPGFSEEHKQRAAQLLVTVANLERGYQAFRGSGNLQVFQPQVGTPQEREFYVRLGLPRIIRLKKTLQNSITARFTGKLVLGPAALCWRFSVPHEMPSHSVPRGDNAP